MQRLWQWVLIGGLLWLSWLGMMAVHELGHVLNALASGGKVVGVFLDPRELSQTVVAPNPHPLFVAWGGVVWGSLLPALAFWAARRWRLVHLPRFFAGFCAAANGAYLLVGLAAPAGDPADLAGLGVAPVMLVVAGVLLLAAGLWAWHGQGAAFGLGPARRPVERGVAVGVFVAALLVTLVELALAR